VTDTNRSRARLATTAESLLTEARPSSAWNQPSPQAIAWAESRRQFD